MDGAGPQTVMLDGKTLTVTDPEYRTLETKGAVFEVRKRFGREFLWLGILLFFLGGLGVFFIILYYYVKKEVLVVSTEEGEELEVAGGKEVLDDLHYLIQKRCLKARKKEDEAPVEPGTFKRIRGKKGKGLLCPQCGSDRLYYEAAFHTGRKYHCKDCDYIGAFVIER